jgi:hypothetical protein
MWTDQKWFLDHPGTKEYWRQVKACDLQSKTLENIVWEDGKIPKVRVSHVRQGVSMRHLSEVEPYAIVISPPDYLNDPETAAPLRWSQKIGSLLGTTVRWKPTPENFQLNFPRVFPP